MSENPVLGLRFGGNEDLHLGRLQISVENSVQNKRMDVRLFSRQSHPKRL